MVEAPVADRHAGDRANLAAAPQHEISIKWRPGEHVTAADRQVHPGELRQQQHQWCPAVSGGARSCAVYSDIRRQTAQDRGPGCNFGWGYWEFAVNGLCAGFGCVVVVVVVVVVVSEVRSVGAKVRNLRRLI
jgi:hypothetical protein